MRNKVEKKKVLTAQDILDSDDELPSEYIDIPFVPAYQNDNRFDHIIEKRDKGVINYKNEKINQPLSNSVPETMVVRGYLNKKDTFCFKSLEPTISKRTQQWFFNFLILKDLQSSYTFLTTCLVPNYDKY